ncbi:MAG: hypothetical protein WAX89_02120, partial [Alphaproteobacteria bacterium]
PLREAALLYRQLKDVVMSDNAALGARDTKKVEENLKQKTRLALKLEKLLGDAKANKDVVKQDPDFHFTARALQAEIEEFEVAARKNMMLLKAAHQVRADTLQIIRHVINERQPKVDMYNARGTLASTGKEATLVNKAV